MLDRAMATAVLPHVGDLAAALRALLSLLAPPAQNASLPVRLTSDYARRAADEVLAAEDLEDLGERLDAMAGDEELWEQVARQSTPSPPSALSATFEGQQLDVVSLTRVLGPTATKRCLRAHTAMKAGIARLVALQAGFERAGLLPEGWQPPDSPAPLEMVYDVSTPAALRRFLLGLLRWAAATFSIARAEEHGDRLSPWLALGLANAWSEGPERFEATVASSDALIAWFVAIFAEAKTAEELGAAFAQWRDAAHASTENVYFPFDAADRETQ